MPTPTTPRRRRTWRWDPPRWLQLLLAGAAGFLANVAFVEFSQGQDTAGLVAGVVCALFVALIEPERDTIHHDDDPDPEGLR
jgi:hypothetical protein